MSSENHVQRIVNLARSFPTLINMPGIEPWDPETLDLWAAGPAPSQATRHAARFVLSVWGSGPWRCSTFDVVSAFSIWDDTHRSAFLEWARSPWWP